MLNQVVIVGRIEKIEEIGEGIKLTLKVPRSYKNDNGDFETDYIPISVKKGMAENIKQYCAENDLVGIKGRIESNNNGIELIAEKATFLSSSQNKKPDDVLNIKNGE